jgi:hypothetical protein
VVTGVRRQEDRLLDPFEQSLEALAPLSQRQLAQVGAPFGQDVEGDVPGRRGFTEHPDARVRRVDALLQGAKVQAVFRHDDKLPVQHDLVLTQPAEGG